MKKLIAILICLAMLILPGCEEKEDVYILLSPAEADLFFASEVVLEPDEPPYNLGGWTMGDDVWWNMELPRKDTYTVRIWYSMPSDYEACTGWLSLHPMEKDSVHEYPVFTPTSADGGWEVYDYVDVTAELPEGLVSVSLEPDEIPEGQDYFINLRSIEVFTGKRTPAEPRILNAERPAVTEPQAEGTWWICSGGFPGSGTGLAAAIFVKEETCDLYNKYGQKFGTYPCTAEDDELTVDLGGEIGEYTYQVSGEHLVDTEYDTVEFELSGEPEFWDAPYFDGSWYRCGDPENPSYYEIEDGGYREIFVSGGEPEVTGEGFCIYDDVDHYTNDLVHYDIPHFFMEGLEDRNFYPVMDGVAFYTEEDLEYKAYVFEGACDPEYVWAWMAVEDLMNGVALGETSDGTELLLHFEGYGYYMTMFAPNGERLDNAPYGSWVLRNDGCIEMEGADGTWLEFPIPDDGDTIVYPFNGEDVVLEVSVE